VREVRIRRGLCLHKHLAPIWQRQFTTYKVSEKRRELEQCVREVIQRVRDARLEEPESLYGNREVMIVGREVFRRFRIAVSVSAQRARDAAQGRAHRSSASARGP
jgi:hypothetical protein